MKRQAEARECRADRLADIAIHVDLPVERGERGEVVAAMPADPWQPVAAATFPAVPLLIGLARYWMPICDTVLKKRREPARVASISDIIFGMTPACARNRRAATGWSPP